MRRHVGRHRFSSETEHLGTERLIDQYHGDVGELMSRREQIQYRIDESDAELAFGEFIQHRLEEPRFVTLVSQSADRLPRVDRGQRRGSLRFVIAVVVHGLSRRTVLGAHSCKSASSTGVCSTDLKIEAATAPSRNISESSEAGTGREMR